MAAFAAPLSAPWPLGDDWGGGGDGGRPRKRRRKEADDEEEEPPGAAPLSAEQRECLEEIAEEARAVEAADSKVCVWCRECLSGALHVSLRYTLHAALQRDSNVHTIADGVVEMYRRLARLSEAQRRGLPAALRQVRLPLREPQRAVAALVTHINYHMQGPAALLLQTRSMCSEFVKGLHVSYLKFQPTERHKDMLRELPKLFGMYTRAGQLRAPLHYVLPTLPAKRVAQLHNDLTLRGLCSVRQALPPDAEGHQNTAVVTVVDLLSPHIAAAVAALER